MPLVSTLLVLAACSSGAAAPAAPAAPSATPPATAVPTTAAPTTTVDAAPPPVPSPGVEGECPYLPAADVASTNGQKVLSTLVDTADPPACAFTGLDGRTQLTVWVLRATGPAQATAVVDRAAPVGTTDPASEPAGWTGGRSGSGTGDLGGAVYAVADGATAVVVTTNQEQSLKAQRIAEQVIATLGLP
ncbi:DUF2020 domain-containing protein [Rhodococcus aerolatus]